jgi:hypothetical protein
MVYRDLFLESYEVMFSGGGADLCINQEPGGPESSFRIHFLRWDGFTTPEDISLPPPIPLILVGRTSSGSSRKAYPGSVTARSLRFRQLIPLYI